MIEYHADINSLIVVSNGGEKYVGWLDLETDNPFVRDDYAACESDEEAVKALERYVDSILESGGALTLLSARRLLTNVQMATGPAHGNNPPQIMGVHSVSILIPVDAFSSPVERLKVVPTLWYLPGATSEGRSTMQELISQAEENEMRSRAARLGLHLGNSGHQ